MAAIVTQGFLEVGSQYYHVYVISQNIVSWPQLGAQEPKKQSFYSRYSWAHLEVRGSSVRKKGRMDGGQTIRHLYQWSHLKEDRFCPGSFCKRVTQDAAGMSGRLSLVNAVQLMQVP